MRKVGGRGEKGGRPASGNLVGRKIYATTIIFGLLQEKVSLKEHQIETLLCAHFSLRSPLPLSPSSFVVRLTKISGYSDSFPAYFFLSLIILLLFY